MAVKTLLLVSWLSVGMLGISVGAVGAVGMADMAGMVMGSESAQPSAVAVAVAVPDVNPTSTLECHRRQYTYRVTKTDSAGRICWDTVSVMSCWGRCDSNEISDWRFPYKRSSHPVCQHETRQLSVITLRNCDALVEPGTERYESLDAVSCRCAVCKSAEASCEGLRYRGQRSGPFAGLGKR